MSFHRRLLLAALLAPAAAAFAQADLPSPAAAASAPFVLPDLTDTYVPPRPPDDTLYRALGAAPGLERLARDFLDRLLADPRTGPFFSQADPDQFRREIALEFCTVSGGPCHRKRNVRRLHSAMDIDKSHFNAVVELLQQSLDASGVPFAAQNRLLAVLAPMHRDIITLP
jgi:hemoglobin